MAETIIEIPLDELHPFPDHPFGVRDDDMMQQTVESDIVNIGLHFFLKNVRPYAASCSEA